MSPLITLFITSLCVCSHATNTLNAYYNDWESFVSPTIPKMYGAAISYGEEEIWILGGSPTKEALISYNIKANTVTNHGDTWLSQSLYGTAQYYAQMNDRLYIINDNSFTQFDTSTKTATYSYQSISPTKSISSGACLASVPNYLFVLGQGDGGDTPLTSVVQIINLQNNIWLSNIPAMNS
eukprot:371242_1